jgi:adenylate cyclase
VELGFLNASRRGLGLPSPDPDERLHGEKDLEATQLGTLHRQAGFNDEDALEVARVLGQGMARYAESAREEQWNEKCR